MVKCTNDNANLLSKDGHFGIKHCPVGIYFRCVTELALQQ